ncbi:MAG: S-layer homology domain-containing protein [Clostridia bacterium]|nr:S-layer homology domain-containing protein [Clostridia bacterium]
MKKRIISLIFCIAMILSAFSVSASAAGLPFTDVKFTDWFYNDVKVAYESGLINGKSATKFDPYATITYVEVIKLAAVMEQKYLTGTVTLTNGDPWYEPYVDYCENSGIIGSGEFVLTENATRAGFMKIFAAALPSDALKPVNSIPDNSIPDVLMTHPQANSIYKLYRAGVLQGSDTIQHLCKPTTTITRCEVAAILNRMLNPSARIIFQTGDPLSIKTQPVNATAASRYDHAKFTVEIAGGQAPYVYQWQVRTRGSTWRNITNNDITGVNTKTLDIRADGFIDSDYEFRCVVRDNWGGEVYSNAVRCISPAFSIAKEPQDMDAVENSKITLEVKVANGHAPYTYQWQYLYLDPKTGEATKWINMDIGTSTKNELSDSITFRVDSRDFEYQYHYRCVVTDAFGDQVATKGIKLTRTYYPLTVIVRPGYTDVRAKLGTEAKLAVTPSGGKAPYKYQWQYRVKNANGVYGSWWDIGDFYWVKNEDTAEILVDIDTYEKQYRCVVIDARGYKVYSDTIMVSKP